MRTYWDSSALASLYLRDVHFPIAEQRMQQRSDLVLLSPLNELEVTVAIEQRVFRGELKAAEARLLRAGFAADLKARVFEPTALPPVALNAATRLAAEHAAQTGARSLDILHVAIALELGAEVFFTFDRRQRALARKAGLKTAG